MSKFFAVLVLCAFSNFAYSNITSCRIKIYSGTGSWKISGAVNVGTPKECAQVALDVSGYGSGGYTVGRVETVSSPYMTWSSCPDGPPCQMARINHLGDYQTTGGSACTPPEVLVGDVCQLPPTANEQAALDAQAAALSAGHTAAEAQTAYDAVIAHSAAPSEDWPEIGNTAAISHQYAHNMGVPPADAAIIGMSAADIFVNSPATGVQRALGASLLASVAANRYSETAFAQSQAAASGELLASIAAGVLTVGGAVAVAAGGPLTAAIGVSAMVHGAILAANLTAQNPLASDAVQAVMSSSIGSAANPMQVTLISEAEFAALPSASTSAQVLESSAQVARVVTAPESVWDWSNVTAPVQYQAATTAANVSNTSVASGFSQSQTTQAVNAAVSSVVNGLSTDAAVVAADAAGTATALGYSSAQAQTAGQIAGAGYSSGMGAASAVGAGVGTLDGGATEYTLKGVLDAIKAPFTDPVATLGDIPATEEIPVETPAFDYSVVDFASNSSCPADVSYSMMGRSYTLSYFALCDWLVNIRPLFLAIAAMSAVFVFAGVKI